VAKNDKLSDVYEIAAGPWVSKNIPDSGGHSRGKTPSGHYVLDGAEHHVTQNWPASVVPWGAAIREEKGVIEYQVHGTWRKATGPTGSVTVAIKLFATRSHKHLTAEQVEKFARAIFLDSAGNLVTSYERNDFGKWSWNLKKRGVRTAYYIHTTPENELAAKMGASFTLETSHGCVHIRPADRDEMVHKGYLKRGVPVEVRAYGESGPPK
jgi:hypothetical protein